MSQSAGEQIALKLCFCYLILATTYTNATLWVPVNMDLRPLSGDLLGMN